MIVLVEYSLKYYAIRSNYRIFLNISLRKNATQKDVWRLYIWLLTHL